MLSRCLGRAAPLLAFCSLALAQSGEDAVVVTASRTEQRVRDTIPHTTVLTRKEIQDSQAVDLPTILRREAGVEVVQDGGLGQTARLSIRGSRTAQVLVLIDGVRVEDSASSTTALQHLMLDDIERIEVVRGNVSSLYGSNAMGGVVQVFTRRGTGAPAPYGELTAGSHDTTKLLAGYGGEFGDTRLNVSRLAARYARLLGHRSALCPQRESRRRRLPQRKHYGEHRPAPRTQPRDRRAPAAHAHEGRL
jgi:vitamin B12 transporter